MLKSNYFVNATTCVATACLTLGSVFFLTVGSAYAQTVPPTQRGEATPPPDPLAPPPNDIGPTPTEFELDQDVEPLTRGPIHEAFAASPATDPTPGVIVPKKPPEDISEVPPENEQADDSEVEFIWIPGYWAWDEDRNDFIWVSGAWRAPPPDRSWVPGYWHDTESGYQWISGFWAPVDVEELSYVEPPPPSIENGPSIPAPSDDHYWVPGNWVYQTDNYDWQPGHWCEYQEDRTWVPAHYVYTPSGCIYVSGYWDYVFPLRGQLYAPVYFRRPVVAYRPHCALRANNLFMHLFLSRYHRNYFFGDYYGVGYRHRGWYPLFQYGYASRRYDPLYAYYHSYYARRGIDCHARLRGWHDYYSRHAHYRPPRTWSSQVAFAASFSSHKHHARAVLVDAPRHSRVAINKKRSPMHGRAEIRRDQIRELSRDRRRLEEDNALAMARRTGNHQLDSRPRRLTIPDDLRANAPRNRFSQAAHAHRSNDDLRERDRRRRDADDLRQRRRFEGDPQLGKRGKDLPGRRERQLGKTVSENEQSASGRPKNDRIRSRQGNGERVRTHLGDAERIRSRDGRPPRNRGPNDRSASAGVEDLVRSRRPGDNRAERRLDDENEQRPQIDARAQRNRDQTPRNSGILSDRIQKDLKLRRTKTITSLNAANAAAGKRARASTSVAGDAKPATRSQPKSRSANSQTIRGNNESGSSLRRTLDRLGREIKPLTPSKQRTPKAAPSVSNERSKTVKALKPRSAARTSKSARKPIVRNSLTESGRTPKASPARPATQRPSNSSRPTSPKRITPSKAGPAQSVRGRSMNTSPPSRAKTSQRSAPVKAEVPKRSNVSPPSSRTNRTPKASPPARTRSAPRSNNSRASVKTPTRTRSSTKQSATVQKSPRSVRSRSTPSSSSRSLSGNRQGSMKRASKPASSARSRAPKSASSARQRSSSSKSSSRRGKRK